MANKLDVDWRDRINDAYYDRMGADFGRVTRDRIHWMLSQATGTRVLDVGCSQGIGSILLGREGFEVLGIDLEPSVIQAASDALGHEIQTVRDRVEFRCVDLYELSSEKSYDTVLAGEVIEHQANPSRFIGKLLDLLVDGGRLIITTPFGLNLWPDHKTTIFPDDLFGAVEGRAIVKHIDVSSGYIRATFARSADTHVPDAQQLQALMRAGVLEVQELYHRVVRERKAARESLTDANKRLADLDAQKGSLEQSVLALSQEKQVADEEVCKLRKALEQHMADLTSTRQELESLREECRNSALLVQQFEERLISLVRNLGEAFSSEDIPHFNDGQDPFEYLEFVEQKFRECADPIGREKLEEEYTAALCERDSLVQENRKLSAELRAAHQETQALKASLEQKIEDLSASLKDAQLKAQEMLGMKAHYQRIEDKISTLASKAEKSKVDLARMRHTASVQTQKAAELDIELQAEKIAAEENRLLVAVLRSSIAFQLGRSLLDAGKSVSGFLNLPVRLWRLASAARSRSNADVCLLSTPVISFELPSVRRRAEEAVKRTVRTSPKGEPPRKKEAGDIARSSDQVKLSQSVAEAAPTPIAPKVARTAKGPIALTILDEMSQASWAKQFRIFPISRQNYKTQILGSNAKFALLESCWRGNDGKWEYAFTSPNLAHANAKALLDALQDLRQKKVPVIFWNKEDPMHYERFLPIAKKADLVFTTDSDMLPHYKRDIPGVNVDVLPFAAEISLCNPAERFRNPNVGTICFAGSYYGEGHDERKRQMDRMLPLITTFDGVIYDRMSKLSNPRYAYPAPYLDHIRPSVPFNKMVELYKSFKVFLNVNTITSSPTMMSRRVYELLASGTPVVSTPSAAIEEQFPGIVQVAETAADGADLVERLLEDTLHWDRISHLGYREVMSKHSYSDRASSILRKLDIDSESMSAPTVSVVMCTRRPWLIDRICKNLTRQVHPQIELIFVLKEFSSEERRKLEDGLASRGKRSFLTIKIIEDSSDRTLGERFNLGVREARGNFIAKMDDDDIYFPNYLSDMVLPFTFGNYALVGKKENFVYLEGSQRLIRRFPGARHRVTDFVAGPTFVAPREILLAYPLQSRNRGEDSGLISDLTAAGLKIYSADPFNFVQWRSKSALHTWQVEEEFFLNGQGRLEASHLDDSLVAI